MSENEKKKANKKIAAFNPKSPWFWIRTVFTTIFILVIFIILLKNGGSSESFDPVKHASHTWDQIEEWVTRHSSILIIALLVIIAIILIGLKKNTGKGSDSGPE